MPNPLTPRQLAFVDEYMKHSDGTKAAKSAGYSDKTAHVQASQLLRHPSIAAEISRRRVPIEKKSQLTAEKIYEALSHLVDFDPGQLFDASGKLLKINEMPVEARKAIAGLDGEKLRFISRLGAIELSAKLLGMVKEQQTQQQAVQIIIAQPPALPDVSVSHSQLLPEWE